MKGDRKQWMIHGDTENRFSSVFDMYKKLSTYLLNERKQDIQAEKTSLHKIKVSILWPLYCIWRLKSRCDFANTV